MFRGSGSRPSLLPLQLGEAGAGRPCERLCEQTGLNCCIARPANVTGRGSLPWVTVVSAALAQKAPIIVDGGLGDAGLIHVKDVASALIRLAEHVSVGKPTMSVPTWRSAGIGTSATSLMRWAYRCLRELPRAPGRTGPTRRRPGALSNAKRIPEHTAGHARPHRFRQPIPELAYPQRDRLGTASELSRNNRGNPQIVCASINAMGGS
ncbi:MAG: hypothetical protein CM15mP74_00220 [Halieaceae bacterium]|nr:MAG: hypothetical protein CM15mP74_00220 [Halieaceae bacterium]